MMKNTYGALNFIIAIIAVLVFVAGLVLTVLGIVDFVHAFDHFTDTTKEKFVVSMAIAMLQAVDLFLISVVLYVFSLGLLMLFSKPDKPIPIKVPEWLRVKSFIQLKLILWETILTTLVVSYLAGLVRLKLDGHSITYESLYIPAGIFVISLSLYFLKKGEH